MTNSELKNTVIFVNKVTASNNPKTSVSVLKKYGYKTSYDILSADQIEKALWEMYTEDPKKYASIIKQIPYREDITNWTTSPETKNRIKEIAQSFNISVPAAKINWESIWNTIKDNVTGVTTTTGPAATVISAPAIKTGTIIILAVISILAIILLINWYRQSS